MSTENTIDRDKYLEQLKFIERGNEPDQYLKGIRFRLLQRFERILKKGIQPPDEDFKIPDDHWAKPLEALRMKYDDLAVHYANLYRGGYIFNYLGFALAIMIASSAFTVLYYKDNINEKVGFKSTADVILLILGLMKLFVIVRIIRNTHDLKDNYINSKYIDFRYVSERVRFFVAYAILGKKCPLEPVSGGHLEKLLKDNTGYLFYKQKVTQEINKMLIDLKPGQILNKEAFEYLIKNQFRFHNNREQRHRTYENKLKHFSEFLNNCVKWFVIVDIIIAIFYLSCCCWTCLSVDSETAESAKRMMEKIHHATPFLVILTIVVPAFVAAIVAITAQSEYSKLAARNGRLSTELQDFVTHYEMLLAADEAANQSNGTRGANSADEYFQMNFNAMAQKLLDEVTEWTLIYEKEVHEM